MTKILIVDDEPDILDFLSYNLRREGFEVITAASGKEALETALKTRPNLIILDIMMPEMDGVEVCRRLRGESVQLLEAQVASDRQFDLDASDWLT